MAKDIDIAARLPLLDLMPTPAEQASFNNVRVTPGAGPRFTYSFVLPDGWYSQLDSSRYDPVLSGERFSALGVFSPGQRIVPPLVLSFGVILVPDRGSVAAFFQEYCRQENYEIAAMRPQQFLAGMVIDGLVSHRSPVAGDLTMRLAMFEDAGRLFALGGMAPSDRYAVSVRVLSLAMYTFEPQWLHGATLPLT